MVDFGKDLEGRFNFILQILLWRYQVKRTNLNESVRSEPCRWSLVMQLFLGISVWDVGYYPFHRHGEMLKLSEFGNLTDIKTTAFVKASS